MLENNTYIDFMKKNYNAIAKIMEDNVVSENEIILIDYDEFKTAKSLSDIIFLCDIEKLPEYARIKISICTLDDKKKLIGLKHCGLCMISNLPN
jgi:hypothetical protein